jgi:hypothetical protein
MDQNELVEQMAIIYKKLDNDQSRQLLEVKLDSNIIIFIWMALTPLLL